MSIGYLCDKFLEYAKSFKFPMVDYESEFKSGKYDESYFTIRDYLVRPAQLKDMDSLLKIERDCWAEKVRADKLELQERINSNACLNFALEYQGEVVGVLYTQRLYEANIRHVKSNALEKYRVADGECIQLITLNVRLDYQDRGWGYELLEFALEYFSLHPEIKHVYAVTRCRDFLKSGLNTMQEYMKARFIDGKVDDPTLQFHQSHGAKVLGLVKNYRPDDFENQGCGILIKYNIKERVWIGGSSKGQGERKKNAGVLLIEFINKRLDINTDAKDKTLHELGLDSLDFTELLAYLQQELGVNISTRQLNSRTLNEIIKFCENENVEAKHVEKQVPLQKRMHSIMKKYEEVVPLTLEGEGPLTFWIHPLSGDVGIYSDIANESDGSFRMIAIKACGFLSMNKEPLTSVVDIAKYYCEIITAIQPQGYYHIAGFSFGGTIAYEMVYQLQLAGKKIDTLILVEAPYIDGSEKDLFVTNDRNNLLMNANFLLLTLLSRVKVQERDSGYIPISKEEIADVPNEKLLDYIVKCCKKRGLKQSEKELAFKISSMAKVHSSNLGAIRSYKVLPLLKRETIRTYLFRTKSVNAVSKKLWNPDYLENIQRKQGSLLPLMKKWSEVFPSIKNIILNGDNHFDIFHDKNNIKQFYAYCKDVYVGQSKESSNHTEPCTMPIAIIGMSGRFPGADNVNELWENLKTGRNSIKEFPKERGCNIDDFYDSRQKIPGKSYVKRGGFISNVDQFDPLFFKISPREAVHMDPSERIFMEETWKAIEDAGYNPKSISEQSWGAFCCAKGDYEEKIVMTADRTYYNPTNSFASSRISYFLNLTGPAVFSDTACSSTLTVIEEACDNLVLGNCEVAIAGGGGIYSTPSMMVGSSQSLLFSTDEKCYTFDARANGTVIGEAIGVVILKPLEKAIADKDHIYGVIRGWGINQDGKTNGITAPSSKAQTSLQKKVYERFKISPENITMIEAHGTGTELGDAIEFQALTNTFQGYTDKKGYCSLGSYKPNLGHAFFGSGILGVIKLLLSLRYKQIPPMLNFEKTNPNIDIENSPFYITTKLKNWESLNNKPLCGAINSFGATGTNVHLVIEEYKEKFSSPNDEEENKVVFLLSAEDSAILDDYVQKYIDAIDKKYLEDKHLIDMAYTLQHAREHMKYRLGFVIKSINDLRMKLVQYQFGKSGSNHIFYGKIGNGFSSKATNTNDALVGEKSTSDLEKLISLWIEGYWVDWNMLNEECDKRRISLPTYPFAKEHIWIDKIPEQQAVQGEQIIDKKKKKESLYLFAEQWLEKEIKEKPECKAETIVCLVSKETNQRALKEQFIYKNSNVNVVFIAVGLESLRLNQDCYTVNTDEQESFQQAFRTIVSENDNISKIIYFWPYEEPAYVSDYKTLLHIIKALAVEQVNADKLLLIGQYQNGLQRCYLESWIGFERSLGNMIFRTQVNTIMFESDNLQESIVTENDAEKIVLEANASNTYKSSVYNDGKRYELEVQPQTMENREVAIKRNGTYLITGGMGKLGFLFAKHLTKQYNANLVLTGRKILDEERESRIRELEKIGGNVIYVQADVCNKAEMENVIREAVQYFTTIDGVLYMAGTANEVNILNKDIETFCQTIEPKINGIQILSEVLEACSVDFICYFSSLAAVLGDFGMCDYSLGNRFEMAYSAWLNHLQEKGEISKKTIAVGWPLWRDGGMKLSGGNSEAYLNVSGQRYLETEEGIALFEQLLSRSNKEYFVIAGDKKKIYNNLKLQNTDEEGQTMTYSKELKENNQASTHELVDTIEMDIKKIVNEMQGITVEKLDVETYLTDYGFDSIILFDFARRISDQYKIDINATTILGYPTISQIAQYLAENYTQDINLCLGKKSTLQETNEKKTVDKSRKDDNECAKTKDVQVSSKKQEPIAIIGMSGRFPQTDTVDELWNKLFEKEECITRIPKDRWREDEASSFGQLKCKRGGFIKGIDEFDPLFFNISPKEAKLMDPSQRVFLQEAWHSLEDAGYMGERIKGKSCGVFVGAEESQYAFMARKSGNVSIDQNAMLSSRIAYALDLKGPNMSVTASCSSGLVALHQACLSLRNEDCDMAIAGGVCLITSPVFYEEMDRLEMLSEDGKAYVFDSRVNGLVPSETVAAVVLKPLSKAIADHDHVYGYIKGSGVNYNGRGTGIMSPNPRREAELMENVLEKYDVNPQDIQYIMTHSVGIPLGDASEIEGLKSVFRNHAVNSHECYLGTVKPIVGHTFAASGITSLISMLLAMKNKTIFGVSNFETQNPNITLNNTPFIINVNSVKWERRNNKPLQGAISTFANSGTNAFAVIEEYVQEENLNVRDEQEREHIFNFQASDEQQLYEVVKMNCEFIEKSEMVSLDDIAYTLQTGRMEQHFRMAIVTNSRVELLNRMHSYLSYKEGKIPIQKLEHIFMSQPDNEQEKVGAVYQRYEKMMLKQMIENHDLEMLCVYWTRGNHMEWNDLYHTEKEQHLVSLPGYPFKKDKYWYFDESEVKTFENEPNRSIQEKNVVQEYDGDSNNVKAYILSLLSDWLGLSKEKIELNRDILDYGMNSIMVMKFAREFGKKFDCVLASREVFQYPTVNLLSEYLNKKLNLEVQEDLEEDANEEYHDSDVMDLINEFREGSITIDELKNTMGVKKND